MGQGALVATGRGGCMRAMQLESAGSLEEDRARLVDLPTPDPRPGEVRLRVRACGVCRTDLHLARGELAPPSFPLVPGHQAVGFVEATGRGARRFREGDRVGASWLHSACGVCGACTGGRENLCPHARFTGFHVPGGYAESLVLPEAFAHPLPPGATDTESAPLLCAGILGYRALRLSGARAGDRLGLVGFGGSAHLVLQVARHEGCEVQVVTRSSPHRELALRLGATFAGSLAEVPAATWNSAILFAPAGELVPGILTRLRPAGVLSVAAIYLSPIPALDYERTLFGERVLRSVTASTRRDAEEFLCLAGSVPVRSEVRTYPLDQANEAFRDLDRGDLPAAAVLTIN